MAKGQRRSNRETKKPKQPKSEKKPLAVVSLVGAERDPLKAGRDRNAARR